MTTVYDFTPTASAPFQFQPTLDGTTYNVIITWNVFGQRYYINIYDLSGNLILCMPFIGSPLNYDLSLTAGYFSSTMVYRIDNAQIEVSP